jgi:hypothetical protein
MLRVGGVNVQTLFVGGLGCVGEGEPVSEDARRTRSAAPAAARAPAPALARLRRRRTQRGQARARAPQVLAALTSERGASLVTLAIGVACRTSVEALAAAQAASEAAAAAAGRPDLPERLMRFAGAPRDAAPSRRLLAQLPPFRLAVKSKVSRASPHAPTHARQPGTVERVSQPHARQRPV